MGDGSVQDLTRSDGEREKGLTDRHTEGKNQRG